MSNKNKVVVILGPTASGKTSFGVKLAKKFNGEIISADSRQVYRGMDIGTGKDLDEYTIKSKGKIIKIPYHLIDVVSPRTEFNLAKYKKLAIRAIDDILKREKLPIIVGGTGLYLETIVENYELCPVKPNKTLRAQLEKLNTSELLARLKALNHKFYQKLNSSDKKNRRRLIRYIEILSYDPQFKPRKRSPKYESLLLGVTWSRETLKQRIYKRLIERIEKEGMIEEVERLHKEGISWKRLISFGLEYKYISLYLKGELNREEMIEKLYQAICQFAKKQMTWFRRWERKGAKIYWINDIKKMEKLVQDFL